MSKLDFRKTAVRLWLWIVILTLVLWIYPITYQTTRLFFLMGAAVVWAGAFFLWWRKKAVIIPLAIITLLAAAVVSLPGRPVQPDSLARDYCRRLRMFRGVRYVWGGEGLLGIDCSGLVRQGLIRRPQINPEWEIRG